MESKNTCLLPYLLCNPQGSHLGSEKGLLTSLLALQSSRVPCIRAVRKACYRFFQHVKTKLALLLCCCLCCPQAYHAKFQQSYGASEPVDILPANCSGLCMAACLSLAFVVLQWLQATPPNKPIVKKDTTNRTRNNACGWCLPYGNLQHLTPQQVEELANTRTATGSDGLADYVSSAESSAGFSRRPGTT